MPSRNSVKLYIENGYYHIYNRGIDKRDIFLDDGDYKMFLGFLKRYLISPQDQDKKEGVNSNNKRNEQNEVGPRRFGYRTDLYEKIKLISYCLMPNHFHLMVKQTTKEAIIDFMRALSNSYVKYFNNRYERTGPLFTGKYKAVLIEGEAYLLHLTRYIHLNPSDLGLERSDLINYPYSSFSEYLGRRRTEWVLPEEILSFFRTAQKKDQKDLLSYQSFVEDYPEDSRDVLAELTID